MVAAVFVYPERAVFAGLVLGMFLAVAMFVSMAAVLEGSIKTGNPETVRKRGVMGGVIRYFILAVILVAVIVWFSPVFHPVAVVIGIMGLKAGALFQPFVHRRLSGKSR